MPRIYIRGIFFENQDMENKQFTEADRQFMLRAMELAERGKGFVNPNPLVGALIVRGDRIIGEGWHEYYGGLHAERNAFKNCIEDPRGATLYVTLEPCCHHGKTPPCVDAVIEQGIARVVVGLKDPNPLVAGKGLEKLVNAGIEVVTGVEEEVLREQNRVFLKYIATGLPWVTLKTAMTLDGKIAAFTGDARWVTGDDARLRVHRMRSEYMGIMVGSGTVKTDDPLLNCRLEGEHRQPVRIVVDSKASVAFDSQVVRTARVFPLLVAHTVQADEEQLEMIQEAGGGTLLCEEKDGRVDITDLLKKLGARGIDSVLLEGGGELNYTFVKAGVIDEVYAFIAPKIVGGKTAKTPVEGEGFKRMGEALELSPFAVEAIGRDILLMARPIVKH
jgi:diaminohydroxyphosphoribosylaminopyrimidine deaminase/5-amino-6-(5-phosphoribosylamino)uracil reductase